MGKSSPSTPTPPDPVKTAQAQSVANKEAVRESALMNQINQVTPYGGVKYSGEIGGDDRTVTQFLSPDQQAMLDASSAAGLQFGDIAQKQLGAVAERFASPVVYGQPPPTAGQEAYQRAYDAIIERNQPLLERQRKAELTRLSNQGLDQGGEAYSNAMLDQNRRENDFGVAAQQAAMGQQAQQFDLDSRSYQQAIQAQLGQRQAPLNELSALMSGSQIQNPQFLNTGQYNVARAHLMRATYDSYNAQANAVAQQQAAAAQRAAGTAGMLGSAAMGAGMYF